MILQLDPPLPMETSRGPGLAHFMIDYGPESHLMWVVFMDADGACWTVPNPEVRMQANWSLQRRPAGKPVPAAPRVIVGSAADARTGQGPGQSGVGVPADGMVAAAVMNGHGGPEAAASRRRGGSMNIR